MAEAACREKVSEQSIGRWKAEFLEAGRTALATGRNGPTSREEQLEAEVIDLSQALGEAAASRAGHGPFAGLPTRALACHRCQVRSGMSKVLHHLAVDIPDSRLITSMSSKGPTSDLRRLSVEREISITAPCSTTGQLSRNRSAAPALRSFTSRGRAVAFFSDSSAHANEKA